MGLPSIIHAGLTATFTVPAGDYGPGAGYTLSLVLQSKDGKQTVTASTAGSGSDFEVTITAANTAGFTAGMYTLYAVAISGAVKRLVGQATVEVAADVLGDNAVDNRTHNRKVLDSLRRVLEGRATKSDTETTVDGISVKRMNLSDLADMVARYEIRVKREEDLERQKAGAASRRNVYIKFGNG